MSLYECGTWFFKIRLTTNCLDEMQVLNIEDKFLEKFDPSKLTAQNPLNPKADIVFGKAAYTDSLLLLASKGSALKKIDWALKNVNENERASGFPDLYLDMHIEAIKAFVQFGKEHSLNETGNMKQYCAELNKIIDAGFLPEYILDQYDMFMIQKEDMENNFEAYEIWKQTHPLSVSIRQKICAIVYNEI